MKKRHDHCPLCKCKFSDKEGLVGTNCPGCGVKLANDDRRDAILDSSGVDIDDYDDGTND